MTQAHSANTAGGASSDAAGAVVAHGIGRWLCLAATPTFAIMALLTAVLGGGPTDMLCSAGPMSPLSGMVPMYLLMSAFHSPPWLKLIGSTDRRISVRPRSGDRSPEEAIDAAGWRPG